MGNLFSTIPWGSSELQTQPFGGLTPHSDPLMLTVNQGGT